MGRNNLGYCCRNDISLLPWSHHTAKQTGPDDEALNNQRELSAEMGIHFPGLKNIDKPVVWVFTELVVCLDCGTTEFAVPEAELRILAKGDAAAAG